MKRLQPILKLWNGLLENMSIVMFTILTHINCGKEYAEDFDRNNDVLESIDISNVIDSFNLAINWASTFLLGIFFFLEYAKKLLSKNSNEISACEIIHTHISISLCLMLQL